MVVKVDLPTPPLPLRTRILCLMPERRAVMKGMSGSGPLGAVAQMDWFGQPAQASPLPARLDSGPGQCSEKISSKAWIVRGNHTRLWGNELGGGL